MGEESINAEQPAASEVTPRSEIVGNWGITTLIWVLCAAPIVLLALLIVIIVKIAFAPVTTGNSVDIAGIAGTVLSVGATMLAIIVGLAAIAWLVKLDKRIDQRTKKQVAKRMEQMRQDQEKILTARFQILFDTRERTLTETYVKTKQEVSDLNNHLSLLLNIAMRPDVEDMDRYLSDEWEMNKSRLTQDMILQVIHRYELAIDRYIATNSQGSLDPRLLWMRMCNWRDRLHVTAEQIKDQDRYTQEEKDAITSNLVVVEGKTLRYESIVEQWADQRSAREDAQSDIEQNGPTE